jgi:hypothetical protein
MAIDAITATLEHLEKELAECPRCNTWQKLHQVLIKKKDWGGRFEPENQAQLCAACDEDWQRYVISAGLQDKTLEVLVSSFQKFLEREVGPQATLSGALAALKELGGLRVQIAIEKVRYESRFRSRGKRLDSAYPLEQSLKLKELSQKGDSWLKFLLRQVAEVKTLKEDLDQEIKGLLSYFPIWEFYLRHVPGVGPYLAGFLIGTIGSIEGRWCRHVRPRGKYACNVCSDKERTIIREGPLAFPSSADLLGYAGLGVDEETGKAERRARGQKLGYDPLLKIVVGRVLPQSLAYQKTRFPWSPYSQLLDSVEKKELQKAIEADPTVCYIEGCYETNILNLGWKCQGRNCNFQVEFEQQKKAQAHQKEFLDKAAKEKDSRKRKILESHRVVFAGYCCQKTFRSSKPHKFFNPAHLRQRILREVGKKFLTDFWHTWLWFLGENPDIQRNSRIITILQRSRKEV